MTATVISTIPTLKSTLIAQLRARSGLFDVQIEQGTPSGTPSEDLVIVGDVRMTESSVVLGNSRRDERYTLDITISCARSGTDQVSCSNRAFVIYDEILSQLRSDPRVSNTVFWALPAGVDFSEPSSNERVSALLVLHVDCRGRI